MAEEFMIKRNLIVNYLPPSWGLDTDQKLFTRVGEVAKCKLVRNNVTGESMGYAFIEYPTEALAASAIKEINGMVIESKTLKVSYARQSSPETKNTNVYVASLPPTISEDQLLDLFQSYGTVLTHKLLSNPDGSSRGAGFVRYATNSEALKAIGAMAGKRFPESDVPLVAKLAIPPKSKQSNSLALSAITTNTLTGVGAAARAANVRYNPLAVINQNVNPSAAASIAGMLTQGTAVSRVAIPNQPASVYVFGLQPTHTELTLYELFSPFGGILNVKVIRDLTKEEQPCKGYGFVNFTRYDDAQQAVLSMNNVPFEDKLLQVSFKQSKSAQLAQPISFSHINHMVPVMS